MRSVNGLPLMTRLLSVAAALLFLLVVIHPSVKAQNFPNGFNFVLPPFDSTSQQFLPVFPARAIVNEQAVTIGPDGHFTVAGKPVRFFGVNIVADAAFPEKTLAFSIAGRLRKMGINLVRFHHMDNPWSSGSLFEQGSDTRHLNPTTLDRLEYFLTALKTNGIYADMNLHVSRTVNRKDGVPDADSIQEFGKGVCFFDPQLLSLHKEYARQLLTHTNPYTGLSLVHEPGMAMVEITNENSLYSYWRSGKLKPFAAGGALTVRHVRLLDSLWNRSLANVYGATDALSAAWAGGAQADGPEQVMNGSFEADPFPGPWSLEMHAPAAGVTVRDTGGTQGGVHCALVHVTAGDGTDWHLQFKQTGLTIQKDSVYIVRFDARADSSRTISVTVMQESSPWTWYAGTSLTLGTAWQSYLFTFRASVTDIKGVRLSFGLGNAAGDYRFDNISMVTTGFKGLLPGETIEDGTVGRMDFSTCPGFSDQRVKDMTEFYMNLQNNYYDQMYLYLKDTLGVTAPVVGTALNYGLPDRAVQSRLDFTDNHAYWDHPSFPGEPWSATDWTITNQPLVFETNGSTMGYLMRGIAVNGKPFTISEYNHGYPNQYQPEAVLFLTAYSAFQDADALMFFDYNGTTDWQTDWINGYFDIHRNSAMMSLIPSCAAAFRSGGIAKARQVLMLRSTADDVLLEPKVNPGPWSGPDIIPNTLPLQHGIRTESLAADASNISSMPPAPAPPYISDTGEITWDPDGLFSVNSEKFVGATGFLMNFKNKVLGDLTLVDASDVSTFTWISLTDSVLSRSGLSLFTLSTKAQNSGMVWDGITSVHDKWGTAPTTMYPVEVLLKLRVNADSIVVYSLSPTGAQQGAGVRHTPTEPNSFTILFSGRTEHTPWFGIETFGHGVPGQVQTETNPLPTSYGLMQNYPNPFNPSTRIKYTVGVASGESGPSGPGAEGATRLSLTGGERSRDSRSGGPEWQVAKEAGAGVSGLGTSNTKIVVYDLLGRQVAVLVDEKKAPGSYEVSFDGRRLASGVYVYRMTAGTFIQSRSMLLVR
jgi:hypothetical protein